MITRKACNSKSVGVANLLEYDEDDNNKYIVERRSRQFSLLPGPGKNKHYTIGPGPTGTCIRYPKTAFELLGTAQVRTIESIVLAKI